MARSRGPTPLGGPPPDAAASADDTVRLTPPAAMPKRASGGRARWLAGGGLALGMAAAAAVWLLWPAPPAPVPVPALPPAPAPEFVLRDADEAAIRDHAAERLTVFRFGPEPAVLVLDFPSLTQQGQMLNRVAALVEKAGLPRDRVLTDAELADAIRAAGDTVASYYFGHDYAAADLVRFFAVADRDRIALGPEEERLRSLLRQIGWFQSARGGLISLSRPGADQEITPALRAVILHHELSHGAFFADAGYADYVRTFWTSAMTAEERAGVESFLAREGYDTREPTLVVNEMQAYLMFTADPAFFAPSMIGMAPARLAALQARFRESLPKPWLRDAMDPLRAPVAPPAAPAVTAPSGPSAPAANRR